MPRREQQPLIWTLGTLVPAFAHVRKTLAKEPRELGSVGGRYVAVRHVPKCAVQVAASISQTDDHYTNAPPTAEIGALSCQSFGAKGVSDSARSIGHGDRRARLTASGSLSMTRSSVAAGPLTRRVPCSHFR